MAKDYHHCRCCEKCIAPKRHVGCHSTCEEYIDWRKGHDKIVQERQYRYLFTPTTERKRWK